MDFTKLKENRKTLLTSLQDLNVDQITAIPAGCNNNILWNFGHVLVVPQYYFYAARGLNPYLNNYYF